MSPMEKITSYQYLRAGMARDCSLSGKTLAQAAHEAGLSKDLLYTRRLRPDTMRTGEMMALAKVIGTDWLYSWLDALKKEVGR